MKYYLVGDEALKEFNKIKNNSLSKAEQEEFNKKIQHTARELHLSVKKCDLEALPDFIKKSNSRLYKTELEKSADTKIPQTISEDKREKQKDAGDHTHQFFKDIYEVTCEDSSTFVVMRNGLGGRMISNNWTKESIDKCAEMAAKLGGQHFMIPSGEPGAFPEHLRAYATRAFAKHGIDLPDPTPPATAKINLSEQKQGLLSTQCAMKEKMVAMRTQGQYQSLEMNHPVMCEENINSFRSSNL